MTNRRRWGLAATAVVSATGIAISLFSCTSPSPGPAAPREEVAALSAELRDDVTMLATDIGSRSPGRGGTLQQAERWITGQLAAAGYAVRREPYEVDSHEVVNLFVEIPGTGPRSTEIVLVGAHYDTVPGTPGANDNGSGVAALLALARRMAGMHPARTVRFVAFTNEEPPYFQTDSMGSLVHAKACRSRGDTIVAMLALETMGCYADERGTQHYPPVVGWFYPSRGNFIAILGDRTSGDLVRDVAQRFRASSDFPCEAAALPGSLQGVGWSDHWSFWQEGYPAVMITDTAPFRYRHYHEATDTPDKMDFVRFARVVHALDLVVRGLANPDA